jgi:hypothetical protein
MLRALLLPLLASFPAVGAPDDPTIRLALANDGRFAAGERAAVDVQAGDDGYLLVVQVDPENRIRILFPIDPTDDNHVRGGRKYTILGRGGREGFATDRAGQGVVFAAISADPWRFDRYTLNDHWDTRTLNGEPVSDPESELVDLANRLSVSRFDYDILPYTVIGLESYADEGPVDDVVVDEVVTTSPGTTVIVDGCLGCWGPTVSVGFGWGLYDPFFYDPWYWRGGVWGPVWNPWLAPVWWNAGWGAPGWGGGWGASWGNNWGWSSNQVAGWQYRMKPWDRQFAGRDVPYRDRWARGALNATNTVAGPMPGTGVGQRVGFRDRLTDRTPLLRNDAFGAADRPSARRRAEGYEGRRAGGAANEPAARERQGHLPVLRRENDQGTGQEPRRREAERQRPGLADAPDRDRRGTGSPPVTRRPAVQQRDRNGIRDADAPRRDPPQQRQRSAEPGRGGDRREMDQGTVVRGGERQQVQRRQPERQEAQRQQPERREPTLERRGSRDQGATRAEGGGSRSPEASRRGSGREGGSSVRTPSGSGRSGGPTPSAPRSGGPPSSRRR